MTERSLLTSELKKITFSRNSTKIFLLLGDLSGAALIAWWVQSFLPAIPIPNHIFETWLLALGVIWVMTQDMEKNLRLDSYLTYTRVFKIAFWAGVSYLL